MRPGTRLFWSISTAVLALVSAVGLVFQNWLEGMPWLVSRLIFGFVQPGTSIWWLVLGGPFRTGPSSPGGIAFAVVTNAVFWLLVLWLAVAAGRALRHIFTAHKA